MSVFEGWEEDEVVQDVFAYLLQIKIDELLSSSSFSSSSSGL